MNKENKENKEKVEEMLEDMSNNIDWFLRYGLK